MQVSIYKLTDLFTSGMCDIFCSQQLSVFQNVRMEEHVHSLVFVSAHKAGLESDVQRVHIIIIVAFTRSA